ncbi:MAG TPA: hypothetical protein PLN53_04050 [Terricaulis sp.]|nr:hypothetical protein [Terricaulis sp.]
MTHQTAASHSSTTSDAAAIVPIIGGGILTVLWGAYALLFVYEMILLGPP